MVATIKRDFRKLMVIPEINYREIHPSGIIEKIGILYLSSAEETEDKSGKGPRGWLAKEPAEVVSLDNPAVYECPALQDLGLIDRKSLIEHYRNVLTARLEAAQKDDKKPYRAQLIEVLTEMIESVDEVDEIVIGGIHRGLAFPDVVAKWRHDQKAPDKELHYKYVETVPCEVLSPVGYADLFAVATERNGRAMSQLGYTFVDLVVLAKFVLVNLMKHQTFFRTFVMTGNPRATEAEVKALKAAGQIKDGGSRYSLPWAVAEIDNEFPELEIIKRLKISEKETDPEKAKKRIQESRLQYGPLEGTDIHRNVNYFRACASAKLAASYFSGSQTKDRETHGRPGTEPAECFRTGQYWTAEQRAAWWNGNCPGQGTMPTQVDTAKVAVDVKRVQGVANGSEFALVRSVADNLINKGGNDAAIADFQNQNRLRLIVTDSVFRLLDGDAASAVMLTRIVASMQAVRDLDTSAYRSLIGDLETLVNETVLRLKGSETGPKAEPEPEPKSEPTPPKGASKSKPPAGSSKSAKKATRK